MRSPFFVALFVVLACDGGGDSADSDASEQESLRPLATLSSTFGTVLTMRWDTEAEGTSRVEWGLDENYVASVQLEGTRTAHSVAVAGLPAGTTVHWRAVSEVDGEILVSPDIESVTGSAPTDLPDLQVESAFAAATGQSPFMSFTIGTSNTVQAYDRTGQASWWQYADDGMSVIDVRLSRDGSAVLWGSQPEDRVSDNSYLRRISWDGSKIEDTPLPDAHHDFVELADGNIAFCQLDVRRHEGQDVVGDAIAEMPQGGDPDTDLRVVWSSWDDLPVRVDATTDTGFYPQGLDWIHCNGLVYDENEGAYYLSSHSLGSILKIDRESGDLLWVFGGPDGQFTLTSGIWFSKAHSPELVEGGFRLFDNGDTTLPDAYSRIVEYEIDENAMAAREVWEYDANRSRSSYVLGDVETMASGDLQLAWGSTGVYEQISLEGESLWTGSLGFGNLGGFAHPLAQLGGPGQSP